MKAGVSLIGSAGGESGWLEALGGMGGGEDPAAGAQIVDTVDSAQNLQGLGEDEALAEGGEEIDALETAGTVASLASGNPMGLVGLLDLFKKFG